jgi:hypothetical protein
MAARPPKVQTRHPTPGKAMPRIDRAVYGAFRQAILEAVPASGDGLPFRELAPRVASLLPRTAREQIGSVSWYATTVKLDLEARGEIERVPGSRPQRLRRKT